MASSDGEFGVEAVELNLVGGIGSDGYGVSGDEAGVEAPAAGADVRACGYDKV